MVHHMLAVVQRQPTMMVVLLWIHLQVLVIKTDVCKTKWAVKSIGFTACF